MIERIVKGAPLVLARMRTAVKFFTWGLVVGLLFAPNAGSETRARLKQWARQRIPGLQAE